MLSRWHAVFQTRMITLPDLLKKRVYSSAACVKRQVYTESVRRVRIHQIRGGRTGSRTCTAHASPIRKKFVNYNGCMTHSRRFQILGASIGGSDLPSSASQDVNLFFVPCHRILDVRLCPPAGSDGINPYSKGEQKLCDKFSD